MFNRKLFLISIILIGFLAVSAVSAADNATDGVALADDGDKEIQTSVQDEALQAADEDNCLKVNDADSVLEVTGGDALSISDADSVLKVSNDNEVLGMPDDWYGQYYYTHVDTSFTTMVPTFSVKLVPYKLSTQYGSGAYFNVKVLNSNTNKPVAGIQLQMKVYTGSTYKTVTITSASNGVARFMASSLPAGNHKIIINVRPSQFVKGSAVTSYANVAKAAAKLYPYRLTTTYASGAAFKVKVVNSKTGKVMVGVPVLMKIFTGNSYKLVTVNTASNGVASLYASNIALGVHKVIASAKDSRSVVASQVTSSIRINKANLVVSAPKKTNYLGLSQAYQIAVKNKATGKGVAGVAVTVKVNDNGRIRTFNVKTNAKGIAGINTKALSKGSHAVVASVKGTSNYNSATGKGSVYIKQRIKTHFAYKYQRTYYSANGSPSGTAFVMDLVDANGNVLTKPIKTYIYKRYSGESMQREFDRDYTSGDDIKGVYISSSVVEGYLLVVFAGDSTYEGCTFKINYK